MIKKECLNYSFENSVLEIKPSGEIDHHNAVKLRVEADGLIKRLEPDKVVLNLSEINFMDSSGLGFIMGRVSLTEKQGGTLTVKKPSKSVQRICHLAGLERIVKFEK